MFSSCVSHSVVSNSLLLHGPQPARLHYLRNSLDRNTRVGCHFLLQCMKVKSQSEVALSVLFSTYVSTDTCQRLSCTEKGVSWTQKERDRTEGSRWDRREAGPRTRKVKPWNHDVHPKVQKPWRISSQEIKWLSLLSPKGKHYMHPDVEKPELGDNQATLKRPPPASLLHVCWRSPRPGLRAGISPPCWNSHESLSTLELS